MRVYAGSCRMMILLLSFLGVILFTFRPGSRRVHQDTANIPFRYDDRPAGDDDAEAGQQSRQLKEARQ
jgi:cytochrome c oxidase cbb3-type subunit 4